MTGTTEGTQRVIDAKFPLTWLIGTGAVIVFGLGSVSFQISGLVTSVAKLEAKTDIRDERTSVISQNIIALQGFDQTQKVMIDRLMSDVADTKRDIDEMKRKQTWAPK